MSREDLKLCKDCKHYNDGVCLHRYSSPVTGYEIQRHITCEIVRESECYCGAEARYFEGKLPEVDILQKSGGNYTEPPIPPDLPLQEPLSENKPDQSFCLEQQPEPDIEQLQARITELEAENENLTNWGEGWKAKAERLDTNRGASDE